MTTTPPGNVQTGRDSGKAKRLRRYPDVSIVPGNGTGLITGTAAPAVAAVAADPTRSERAAEVVPLSLDFKRLKCVSLHP